MGISESILEALQSLNMNKVRSGLTILGVVIGVAAVIAMMAIGNGAQAQITNQIESVGTNLIYVMPGSTSSNGVRQAAGSAATLTQDDANALYQVPNVIAVAPEIDSRGQVTYMGSNTNTSLVGTTPDYQAIRNYTLAEGSFITQSNLDGRSSVAVIGDTVAQDLFGTNSGDVGQSIRINNQVFKVVGVLNAKGGTGFGSQDDVIIIPMTTLQLRLTGASTFRGSNVINRISIKVQSSKQVTAAMTDITDVLEQRHNTSSGTDDFTVSSEQEMLSAMTSVTGVLTIFLGGIAGISLLVGGIGVMNIMLTTVTERTREIGLRKAIGARQRDILLQFMVEAVTLSLVGGIVGTGLGYTISRLVGKVTLSGSTITPVVTLESVLLATLFSLAIGLFFGIYPASRAAGLNPIDALRYE